MIEPPHTVIFQSDINCTYANHPKQDHISAGVILIPVIDWMWFYNVVVKFINTCKKKQKKKNCPTRTLDSAV